MPLLADFKDKPEKFIKDVNDFVSNPRGFLLISGTVGNGKSFTAKAVYEHFRKIKPHDTHVFRSQFDLKTEWFNEENKEALLKFIVEADLFILDDLGKGTPTDAFMEFLHAIMDKRYDSSHWCGTIITTNLNADSMDKHLGGSFVSRVASGICVRHDGPDRRNSRI